MRANDGEILISSWLLRTGNGTLINDRVSAFVKIPEDYIFSGDLLLRQGMPLATR